MRMWLKLIVKPSDNLNPTKKRINTELLIDRNKGFIYKTVKLNELAEQRKEIKNGSIK